MIFPSQQEIAEAVAALRQGEVIGLPTETVYGLAGDASNPTAVQRIFSLKGRPTNHPVIVHLASIEQLPQWASDIPASAMTLAKAFWPGPMTLILKRSTSVSDLVTGGQQSVGIRIPQHPLALAVLEQFNAGLAAPSANRFGHVSPTTAQHVRDEFGEAITHILDGGPCQIGIESTIIDLSSATPRLLRPGQIQRAEIEALLGPIKVGSEKEAPRVSGSLALHYAPETFTELVPRDRLLSRLQSRQREGEHVLVLSIGALPGNIEGLALPTDAGNYARHLYAALRALDHEGADCILIERPPNSTLWSAINDRLQRAAGGASSG